MPGKFVPKGRGRKSVVPKPKRAPRGEGSVLPDKRRGGWIGRVPVGRYENGRTKYVEVRGATQAEAVAKKKLVMPPTADITVGEWAARWVAGLSVRGSTKAGYERQVTKRIVPSLGSVRLGELTVSQVKAALVGWASAGTATANRTLRVGATMWAAAVDDELTATNPFAACKRLKHEPKPLDPFTPTELRTIVGGYEIFAASPLLSFLAATGARVGEACALDIADYDRATGRVSITKTYDVRHGIRPPKSKHSRRTLTVPVTARPAVEYAIGTRENGPVFASRTGRRYDPAELGVVFDAMLARLGIRRRNVHQMRHACASALVGSGVPIGDVAKWMGDSVAQVVKTYVHATNYDVPGAMDRLFSTPQ